MAAQVKIYQATMALLGTLLDMEKESTLAVPRSAVFIPIQQIGIELSEYLRIEMALSTVGYVTIKNNCLSLTEKGREAAKKINDALIQEQGKVN